MEFEKTIHKIRNFSNKKFFLPIVLFFLSNPFLLGQNQYPWPVTPFNQSQEITGNFCEYRSTTTPAHFHNGTDIPKADGSPVYSVKDGRIVSIGTVGSYGNNAWVRVDDKAYVHIQPNPSLSVGDSVFTSQTVLGHILTGLGHVHFTNGYVGSETNSLLMNSGLTPYNDPWPPIIRLVQFYQNNTTNEFPTNELSGLVDIIVKVDEQNAPPGSPTSRLNNGTYKIGYKILSSDSATVVYEPPNGGLRFKFDTKPSNSYVDIVYFQSMSSTSSHVYQVSNDIWQDNYWDTTILPEDDYVVLVFTEDTRQNTDTTYVPVTVVAPDITPPEQPVFRYILETNDGIRLGWFPNTDPDLAGYRLYFSFDNQNWNLFRDETVYTSAITDTAINQILNRDVYFRLTAVDNAPLPNESTPSDIYGMSNGASFPGKVLIVDGFDRSDGGWTQPNHSFVFTHGTALFANQFSFDTVPNESVEDSLVNPNDYDAVFWILGDESSVTESFSSLEQSLVKDYLGSGGFLFVSGSQIAWDLDQDGSGHATAEDEQFLHEYLKADYVSNDPDTFNVTGVTNSIFEGLTFGYGQVPYLLDSANVINPFGASVTSCLKYENTKIAGIQYQGPFGTSTTPGKIVYCAVPFETIPDEQTRNEVMERVLDFFFDITSIGSGSENPGAIPSEYSLLPAYPNPFNPQTTIEYQLPEASNVTLEVYNTLGQKVRTLISGQKNPGRYQIVWNGRDEANNPAASGVYLIRFQAQAKNSSQNYHEIRKIVLVK
jgi:murein DD-endopeptidase MepM/ murein hydrolase activator NlpD